MDNWKLRRESDSTTYDYGYGGYYNSVIGYSRYDDTYGGYYNSITGYNCSNHEKNDKSIQINSYGGYYSTRIKGGK